MLPISSSEAASVEQVQESGERPVTKAQIDALQKCVKTKIEEFYQKGRRNKIGAIIMQIITVFTSIITPVLIGWKSSNEALIKTMANYALISSSVAAGTATLYSFFDYKDLWAQYKMARNELNSILAELDYLAASSINNVTQQQMTTLFKNYIRVCADTNSFYRATRLAKDEERPKQ